MILVFNISSIINDEWFRGGVKFLWRVGELANPISHPESPKCYVEEKKHIDDIIVGKPTASVVTSYAWVYTW